MPSKYELTASFVKCVRVNYAKHKTDRKIEIATKFDPALVVRGDVVTW
jgi:hypothetical protein